MTPSPLARAVALAALGTCLTLPSLAQAEFIKDSKATLERATSTSTATSAKALRRSNPSVKSGPRALSSGRIGLYRRHRGFWSGCHRHAGFQTRFRSMDAPALTCCPIVRSRRLQAITPNGRCRKAKVVQDRAAKSAACSSRTCLSCFQRQPPDCLKCLPAAMLSQEIEGLTWMAAAARSELPQLRPRQPGHHASTVADAWIS